MKVLVTGKYGQLARCLDDYSSKSSEFELVFAARKGADVYLDLTNQSSIREVIQLVKPNVIINAAAYTAVDQAEDEPETAMKINGIAPGILAQEASKCGAVIFQISTDYVFDGTLDRPYRPDDPVNPIGIYGKTKLAGETRIKTETKDFVIIRTAWVYSPYGKNFYKTMLRLAETHDEISVVDDQIGNPTSAHYVAEGLFKLLYQLKNGDRSILGTVRHLVGPEEMSWCGFARKIFQDEGIECIVKPISTDEFPTKAQRPANSRLA